MTLKYHWYLFRQNNSFGVFKDPAERVFIQALSHNIANTMAVEVGIYFDGVRGDVDCECCGDRWREMSEEDVIDLKQELEFCSMYKILLIHHDGRKEYIDST